MTEFRRVDSGVLLIDLAHSLLGNLLVSQTIKEIESVKKPDLFLLTLIATFWHASWLFLFVFGRPIALKWPVISALT